MKLHLRPPGSLRKQLMLGILVPVVIFLIVNAVVLYRQALRAADTAYDRTLLATAKAIGEQLEVVPDEERGSRLLDSVTYSALEAFEADNRSRIYYRVTGFSGELVSGFEDLPTWNGKIPMRTLYAALVDFYDDEFQGTPVRGLDQIACLEAVDSFMAHQVANRKAVFAESGPLIPAAPRAAEVQSAPPPAFQYTELANTRSIKGMSLGHIKAFAVVLRAATRGQLQR